MPPAVRAFIATANDGEDDLIKVACKNAFWTLDRSFLAQLALHMGLSVGGSQATLFDLLFGIATEVLSMDADAVMAYLGRRMGAMAYRSQWTEELLELDEASELLEKNDAQKMVEERTTSQSVRAQEKVFAEKFAEKATELRTSSRSKGGGASRRKTKPVRIPTFPDHAISLESARRCIPPGATLWASAGYGNWQGHYEPFPRVSRSWRRWGERGALLQVLQYLWDCHCRKTGLPREESVEGLWDAVGAGGSSSSGAATAR